MSLEGGGEGEGEREVDWEVGDWERVEEMGREGDWARIREVNWEGERERDCEGV